MTRAAGSPVERLVARLIGRSRAESVEIALNPSDDGASSYAIATAGGRLHIEATDGVAVASAVRETLRKSCGIDPLDLHPERVPERELPLRWPRTEPLSRTSPWRWRYHLNYCTFGYSAAFWDWSRWEREIDLMAMAGVNMPLATVGFEGAWLRALEEAGLSRRRALSYLGSPAYHPWVWMGCVHDHGSAMTESEVEDRVRLGRRILQRERELGMTPVLPGFTGYLPGELADPQARTVDWMGFDNHAVDPGSPVFREFGAALLRAQDDLFGTDGFYAVDPFVEGTPPVESSAEIAAYAEAFTDLLARHDPGSTWVLQGWPFGYRADYWTGERVAAFLGAMPADRTLLLDLWAEHASVLERSDRFAGLPWCWSVLHSLGGRPGLHGAVDVIAREPGALRASAAGAGLVGVGSTMESLGHDPVVWSLLADVRWSGAIDDLDAWLASWVDRRYGGGTATVHDAWRSIVDLCYRDGAASGPPTSVVMSRPRLVGDLRPRVPLNLTTPERSGHGATELLEAWSVLVDALAERPAPALHRDVVEIGLDTLARHAAILLAEGIDAFGSGDGNGLDAVRRAFTDLISAMDALAATHPDFRLDRWVTQARANSATPARALERELDAKRLLTVWVEPGHPLSDYAGRHWAGLLRGYYLPRWELWFDALEHELDGGPRDAGGLEARLATLELAWLQTPLPVELPVDLDDRAGDAVAAATSGLHLLRRAR